MQLRTNYAANRIINAISHNIRHEHRPRQRLGKRARRIQGAQAHCEIKMRTLYRTRPIHPMFSVTTNNPIPIRTHSVSPDSVTTVDVDRECFREAAKPQELSHSKWGLYA